MIKLYQEEFFLSSTIKKLSSIIINMKIGERIKELRLENNLSQGKLADEIGVSQKAIDFWERSVNEPKASYIIKLVKFFNISFNDFFEDID